METRIKKALKNLGIEVIPEKVFAIKFIHEKKKCPRHEVVETLMFSFELSHSAASAIMNLLDDDLMIVNEEGYVKLPLMLNYQLKEEAVKEGFGKGKEKAAEITQLVTERSKKLYKEAQEKVKQGQMNLKEATKFLDEKSGELLEKAREGGVQLREFLQESKEKFDEVSEVVEKKSKEYFDKGKNEYDKVSKVVKKKGKEYLDKGKKLLSKGLKKCGDLGEKLDKKDDK